MHSFVPPRSRAADRKSADPARRPVIGARQAQARRHFSGGAGARREEPMSAAAPSRAAGGLPERLQTVMEAMSGFSLADVVVHRDSAEPARLGAAAYTKGNQIHLAPGQERHLPHETWHAVQQKQGRVGATRQYKGAALNDDSALEREADAMGARAMAGGGAGGGAPASPVAAAPVVQRSVAAAPLPIDATGGGSPGKQMELDLGKGAFVTPEDKGKEGGLTHATIAAMAKERIAREVERAEDTIALEQALEDVRAELGLTAIELVDIGTDEAAVVFHVNPWFRYPLPWGNQVRWKMTGTSGVTDVRWKSEPMQIGGASAIVGKRMVANPLAPDHDQGSTSDADTAQKPLMQMLVNYGKTKVPNDAKFIKGHLLNDNVGGPGAAYNLFPITADANAKHLAFVEKYVKAQLAGSYVIAYEVAVAEHGTRKVDGAQAVDADFVCSWSLLNAKGKLLGNTLQSTIVSRYGKAGAEPLDPQIVYANLFDRLKRDKRTPRALQQSGQWQRLEKQPGMAPNANLALSATPTSPIIMPGEIAAILKIALAVALILFMMMRAVGMV